MGSSRDLHLLAPVYLPSNQFGNILTEIQRCRSSKKIQRTGSIAHYIIGLWFPGCSVWSGAAPCARSTHNLLALAGGCLSWSHVFGCVHYSGSGCMGAQFNGWSPGRIFESGSEPDRRRISSRSWNPVDQCAGTSSKTDRFSLRGNLDISCFLLANCYLRAYIDCPSCTMVEQDKCYTLLRSLIGFKQRVGTFLPRLFCISLISTTPCV